MTPRRTREWLALASLCAGFFMLLLDSTITAVALPAIIDDLDAPENLAIWVNSGYLLAYAVPLVIAGRLGDRFGHRRIFQVGLIAFTVGSGLAALATSIEVLVLWRILQGLGAALLTPQCLTIIRSLFLPPRLAIALGIWGSVGGAAAAAGPLVGGFLVEAWGWPSIFAVNLPLGILTIVAVHLWVPTSTRTRVRIAVWAVVGHVLGIAMLIVGIQGVDADSAEVLHVPRLLWGLGGALIVVVVTVAQRRAGTDALIPVEILRERGFVTAGLGASAAAFCVGSAAIPLMLTLQDDRGMSAAAASLLIVPMGVLCVAAAPVSARLNNRIGVRAVATIGATSLVVSVAGTGMLMAWDAPVAAIAAVFALFGIANSFVWAPFSISAVTAVPSSLVGAASGAFNSLKQLGAVIGSAVAGLSLSVTSDAVTMIVLSGSGLLALAAALLLPRGQRMSSRSVVAVPVAAPVAD